MKTIDIKSGMTLDYRTNGSAGLREGRTELYRRVVVLAVKRLVESYRSEDRDTFTGVDGVEVTLTGHRYVPGMGRPMVVIQRVLEDGTPEPDLPGVIAVSARHLFKPGVIQAHNDEAAAMRARARARSRAVQDQVQELADRIVRATGRRPMPSASGGNITLTGDHMKDLLDKAGL